MFKQHFRKEHEDKICEITKKNAAKKNVLQDTQKYLEVKKGKFNLKVFILAPQRGKSSGHHK